MFFINQSLRGAPMANQRPNFSGSIVFLKADMNVPTDKSTGKILDIHRIMDGINAVKWCFSNKAHAVITISHQGRNKEETLKNHMPIFESYFPNRVKFIPHLSDLPNAVKNSKAGDILLLENIRSLDEEKDYDDVTQTMLYKTLKEVETITNKKIVYAKDDLSVCHRKDLSVYGLPKQLKSEGYQIIAGQLIKNELIRAKISKDKMKNNKIICVWGGGKFDDYLDLFEPFITKYNSIILTSGPLSLLMLKAMGKNIGENESLFGINGEIVEKSAELMGKFGSKIILPKDYYVENSKGKELVNSNNIAGLVVDIGPETVKMYKKMLSRNPQSIIIGNGPLGQYEKLENAKGTIQVYMEAFNPLNKHFIVGGGGDFNTMMDILGFKNYMRSSGGKSFLKLLVFGTLPGLEPLELSID